jgi:nucleoside-diphosphate-sugar epimerase
MKLLVLTGANGFIGRHLLNRVVASGQRVRALTRTPRVTGSSDSRIEWVVGDISAPGTWNRLVEPGCTVVNLAYTQEAATAAAVSATREMVVACATAGTSRLVHCSTISVYGRTAGTTHTETSPCNPIDKYGRIKLAVEQALFDLVRNRFELAVLRPAAVFGQGGRALLSLCDDLVGGARVVNYCRSSLFGRRNMHLVPVDTVVAAIRFLCEIRKPFANEVFIVSDDDDPLNNFRDVERILMEELGIASYATPRVPLPRFVLESLMRLKGRSEINTRTAYRCDKLLRWGFAKPIAFEAALRSFAGAYRQARERRNAA